ncbi:MAG: hypothetical protein JHD16_09975 [Solirubrobacteraceae bacterium]|nr:hypothetical protein [Solirubrobacteraceae bacterium]
MAHAGYRTATSYELRPAGPSDTAAIGALAREVFGPGPDRDPRAAEHRIAHVLQGAHPSSAVALDAAGAVIGATITIQRGPLTVLSLAIVHEDWQSRGVGRALLGRFPAREPGRNRVIMSSPDPKAMRRYAALGLHLRPTVSACGILRPRAVEPVPEAIAISPREGAQLVDAIAQAEQARGVPYGRDVEMWHAQGDTLHVIDDRAAVVRGGGVLRIAVARDPEAGRLALRAALASVPPGETVHLRHLREGQDWAIGEMLRAGLALSPEGPLFSDEPLGPLHLPTGTVF